MTSWLIALAAFGWLLAALGWITPGAYAARLRMELMSAAWRDVERADLAALARERAEWFKSAGMNSNAKSYEWAADLIETMGRELDARRTAAALESWRPAQTRRPAR